MKLKTILATLTLTLTLTLALASTMLPAKHTFAQEAYIGEIKWVGFNFCPRSYAHANGQMLSIMENQALFSLLGTMYGGDGRTTFGLPDLRGRSAVGSGTGPGLSDIRIGQTGGQESVVISTANIPGYIHSVTTSKPASMTPAAGDEVDSMLQEVRASSQSTENTEITNTGSDQPVMIRDPYLGVTACIALQGIYPSRP